MGVHFIDGRRLGGGKSITRPSNQNSGWRAGIRNFEASYFDQEKGNKAWECSLSKYFNDEGALLPTILVGTRTPEDDNVQRVVHAIVGPSILTLNAVQGTRLENIQSCDWPDRRQEICRDHDINAYDI